MSDQQPEFYTVKEVAKLLRVSDETIRDWANNGRLPNVRLPNGHIRIPRADLQEFIKKNYA